MQLDDIDTGQLGQDINVSASGVRNVTITHGNIIHTKEGKTQLPYGETVIGTERCEGSEVRTTSDHINGFKPVYYVFTSMVSPR